MYLKRHLRRKGGKEHVYYSVSESTRVSNRRSVQRQVLRLGELNTTQLERWQRSIEVLEENGQSRQLRLFTDRDAAAPRAEDVCEVLLSSLAVRRPREFGAPWLGCRLFEAMGFDEFFGRELADHRGPEDWAKVVELLTVNRLCAPGSELSVHERWFDRTAMDFLLGAGPEVAAKDRLYRALDKIVGLKNRLEVHVRQRWQDMFGAQTDIVLYDLTSTYFEGGADDIDKAERGYSRDHRPDCPQVVLALVVTSEGFPLTYEVFDGNTQDSTSLQRIIDAVQQRHGEQNRVWVFDRGVVSEANLQTLRERGASYLVGTPRRKLAEFEDHLLRGSWQEVAGRPGVKVQLLEDEGEVYVLARSVDRAQKELAMRRRQLLGLTRDLRSLRHLMRAGRLVDPGKVHQRLGRLEERWGGVWRCLKSVEVVAGDLSWSWDNARLRRLRLADGAYLLRTNLEPLDPALLWRQYVQLTEVEEAFRVLKSELAIRPVWHRVERRVEAHIFIAFLGYCLWVCLKQKLRAAAPSLTPARVLEALGSMSMVEVWFDLRHGGRICLPRITEPEVHQQLILHALGWDLPQQPPPKIYAKDVPPKT
jgi:transposase